MLETSHPTKETEASTVAVERPCRKRWQVGTRTLFLLLAAIAVWLAFFINRRENVRLEARIAAMTPFSEELVVIDPTSFAMVRQRQQWSDEVCWDIYLPNRSHRLCLATREIDDQGLAPVMKSRMINAGRHRLVLRQRLEQGSWRVTVTEDGTERIKVEEPKDWMEGHDWGERSRNWPNSSRPADEPLVLLRRRFYRRTHPTENQYGTPKIPSEGIMLWVEEASGLESGP